MKRRHKKKPKARSPMAPPEIRMEDRRKAKDKRLCRGRVLLEDGDVLDERCASPVRPVTAGPSCASAQGIAPIPTSSHTPAAGSAASSSGGAEGSVASAVYRSPEAGPVFGGNVLGAAPAGLLHRIVAEGE